jgi:ERCC4-type nuclease
MIFYDVSEQRVNSTVKLDSVAYSVLGLEAATGSDILVTPLEDRKMPDRIDLDILPHKMVLTDHCAAGFLIQRKSGRDLVGSVPRLTSEILPRMREWSPQCWLLATGSYGINHMGNVVVAGTETGMNWKAFNQSLMSWQLDGGYFQILQDDIMVPHWLQQVDATVKEWHQCGGRPDKYVFRQPTRAVVYEHDRCDLAVLAALPGIGPKKAQLCLDTWGTVSVALEWLTNKQLYGEDYPKGIGPKTMDKIIKCLGGGVGPPRDLS